MHIFKITLAADAPAGASTRAFSGVAYSGGLIPEYNAVIDLSSVALPAAMPLLLQHNHSKVIGKIDGADVVDGALLITGQLFTSDEDAADVIAKADAGAEYQMSIGIWYSAAAQVAEGAAVSVNGQAFAGPLDVLTGGTIREVSVVALGADPETSMVLLTADPAAITTAPAAPAADPAAPSVDPVELSAVMRLAVADARVAELSAQVEDLTTRAASAAVQVVELTAARDTFAARVAALEAAAADQAAADKAAAVEAAVSAAIAAGKVPPAAADSARALAAADLQAFEGLMANAAVIAPQRANGAYTKQLPEVSLSAEQAARADAAGIPHAIFAAAMKAAAAKFN